MFEIGMKSHPSLANEIIPALGRCQGQPRTPDIGPSRSGQSMPAASLPLSGRTSSRGLDMITRGIQPGDRERTRPEGRPPKDAPD